MTPPAPPAAPSAPATRSPRAPLSTADAFGLVLLFAALAFTFLGYAPELTAGPYYVHDGVLHLTAVERLAQTFGRGESPLDPWVSEWVLGYPLWHSYQPLSHFAALAAWGLTLGKAPLPLVYAVLAWLVVSLFPLAVYRGLRGLGGTRLEAGCAAALAPVLRSTVGFGLESGSYAFVGYGLYSQAFGGLILPLAIGATARALRTGRGLAWAGFLVGADFLCHFIYGWAAALTALLLLLTARRADGPANGPRVRLARLAVVMATAGALFAFAVIPMLLDGRYINHSRWEPGWKWDSFGAARVLTDLVLGGLFDSGRLPVVSWLVAGGAILCLVRGRRDERHRFLLAAFVFWLLLFFGRPTWGSLLKLVGASADLHLHRLVALVQLFGLFLGGLALAFVLERIGALASTRIQAARVALAMGVAAAALAIPYQQTGEYLRRDNAAFIARHREAVAAEQAALDRFLDATTRLTAGAEGRVFPGLPTAWGGQIKIGAANLYGVLSIHHVPTLSRMYHAMSLSGEAMVHFDERRPSHYRVYGIRYVAADRGRALPPFLPPLVESGRFVLHRAPGGGYFDLVQAPLERAGDAGAQYEINRDWLASGLVDRRQHVRLRFPDDDSPATGRRLAPGEPLPPDATLPIATPGQVIAERRDGESYRAEVDTTEDAHLLFKMNFHPGWRATVDGQPLPTEMLTPGFLGVPLARGRHSVVLRFAPGPLKGRLLFAGLLLAFLIAWAERRGLWDRLFARLAGGPSPSRISARGSREGGLQ